MEKWSGDQILLNFQSVWNVTKTVSLCSSRLLDSGGIFTFSNGVRMEKISRSVHQGKQAKFLGADCTCQYSPYGDVARSYHPYGDMASGWRGVFLLVDVDESCVDTCPDCWQMGWGHVAQSGGATCPLQFCLIGYVKLYGESVGFDPRTSPNTNDFITLR